MAAADIITIVGPAVGARVLYAITPHGHEALCKRMAVRIAFFGDWLLLVWAAGLIYRSASWRTKRREYILQLFHSDQQGKEEDPCRS
jgi:hypothetical protein